MPGWASSVDPETLDMDGGDHHPRYNWCGCVLAQLDYARHPDLTGQYSEMLADLAAGVGEPEDLWAVAHGFEAETSSIDEYAALTEAWREAVLARRGAS